MPSESSKSLVELFNEIGRMKLEPRPQDQAAIKELRKIKRALETSAKKNPQIP